MNNPLLKEHFPNAKFIESENIDIEDDMIELDETFHIQIFTFGHGYSLNWENNNNTFSSIDFQTFTSVVNKAIELTRKGTNDNNDH